MYYIIPSFSHMYSITTTYFAFIPLTSLLLSEHQQTIWRTMELKKITNNSVKKSTSGKK